MMNVLSAQDAAHDAREISIREVLDEASSRVSEWNLQDHPEIEAKLREAIEAAKQAIEDRTTSGATDESQSPTNDDEPAPGAMLSILDVDS